MLCPNRALARFRWRSCFLTPELLSDDGNRVLPANIMTVPRVCRHSSPASALHRIHSRTELGDNDVAETEFVTAHTQWRKLILSARLISTLRSLLRDPLDRWLLDLRICIWLARSSISLVFRVCFLSAEDSPLYSCQASAEIFLIGQMQSEVVDVMALS